MTGQICSMKNPQPQHIFTSLLLLMIAIIIIIITGPFIESHVMYYAFCVLIICCNTISSFHGSSATKRFSAKNYPIPLFSSLQWQNLPVSKSKRHRHAGSFFFQDQPSFEAQALKSQNALVQGNGMEDWREEERLSLGIRQNLLSRTLL